MLSELYKYIGLNQEKYNDNQQLLKEIQLLEKNDESILENFAMDHGYSEEQVESFVASL